MILRNFQPQSWTSSVLSCQHNSQYSNGKIWAMFAGDDRDQNRLSIKPVYSHPWQELFTLCILPSARLTNFLNCQIWHLGSAASNYGVLLTLQLSLLNCRRSCQLMLSSLVRHWHPKSNSILAWQVLIGRWQPCLACLFPNSCCSRENDGKDWLHGKTWLYCIPLYFTSSKLLGS